MNARTLPDCDPMQIRRITPTKGRDLVGGVLVLDEYEVEDVELATSRLDFDNEVIDCSLRILQVTSNLMISRAWEAAYTVFPSRRWRNFREGEDILFVPDIEHPLLYLGNPIRITVDQGKIKVVRLPEFTIKSGMDLGF